MSLCHLPVSAVHPALNVLKARSEDVNSLSDTTIAPFHDSITVERGEILLLSDAQLLRSNTYQILLYHVQCLKNGY